MIFLHMQAIMRSYQAVKLCIIALCISYLIIKYNEFYNSTLFPTLSSNFFYVNLCAEISYIK